MYRFHATIHALPQNVPAGSPLVRGTESFATLAVAPEVLGGTTFAINFETAASALARLERMYCEPDGSFVWVSSQSGPMWQVDGNLYDRADRLLFVDIKGTCPAAEFDRLLGCLGWPATPVMFQLVHEAVLLAEPEFRRWADSLD